MVAATRVRQVVWLTQAATSFRAPCDACRSDGHVEPAAPSVYLRPTVAGTLCASADVGFVTCGRGHRVVVRRTAGPATLAAVR